MSAQRTIKERGERYGDSFSSQSRISQGIKDVLRASPNWQIMEDDKREALEMIATKISRICYGDHGHVDSWHDIQGYALLVEDRLVSEGGPHK